MPLTEQRRQQLDGIVQQMVANKEKDADVQFVVNDFKSKYENEQPAQPKQMFKGDDLLEKATNVATSIFPGTREIGESLGTIGASAGRLFQGDVRGAKEVLDTQVSIPKLAGAYTQAGAGVAALAAPLPKAATVGGAILKGAVQTGGLAGTMAGGEAARKGGDLKEIATKAFIGGLSGAIVGAVAGGATKAISNITSRSPEAVYNNTLKISQKVKDAGKSPSKFLINEKVWGDLGTFKKAAQEGMDRESAAIAQKAAQTQGGVSYVDIKEKAAKRLADELGGLYSKPEVEAMIERVPLASIRDADDIVPWGSADKVRSQLGKLIGDSKWLQTSPSESVQATQAVYRTLSDIIKDATGTADEFARFSQWIRTNKAVTSAINKADSKFGFGLYDRMAALGGAGLGFASGDDTGERLSNAILGGVGSVALEKTLTSPAVQTGLVQALGKLPIDSAGRISRDAVIQLISNITNAGGGSQQTRPLPTQ